MSDVDPFDDKQLFGGQSCLVSMEPDDEGRFEFEIWIQYTRKGLDAIQVGDLVAVENYSQSKDGHRTYSILTITQVTPRHFAAQGADAYPGHVFESMRSIKKEWESQDDKPRHHTTTIKATAVSTSLQFVHDITAKTLPLVETERNLPMVGGEIHPLSPAMVDAIVNRDMAGVSESPLNHHHFDHVNVKISWYDFLTTHFGVFGFTGVGKSNLVSSIVASLAGGSLGANLVLVDPNDEYLGLLMDFAVGKPGQIQYVNVGVKSQPQPVVLAMGSAAAGVQAGVVDMFFASMKLPRELKGPPLDAFFKAGVRQAISDARIVLPIGSIDEFVHKEMERQVEAGTGAQVRQVMREVEDRWMQGMLGQAVTLSSVRAAISVVRANPSPLNTIIDARITDQNKRGTLYAWMLRVATELDRLARDLAQIPLAAFLQTSDLLASLNTAPGGRIVIVTGARISEVQEFVALLGRRLYDERRENGTGPLTTILLDEADLFIPGDDMDETTKAIRETCTLVARRGRKFALGIGIATQRATMLDTGVMANLHTYFVSKLPRSGDRERVAEAFGISEDQLSPTFTFNKGDWLLISHDATGLKGVPIPTHAIDANQRVMAAAAQWNAAQAVPAPKKVP